MRRALLLFVPLMLVGASPEMPVAQRPYVGIGYAQISTQPGGDMTQKRLMAIRASRLAAMRDLAEQIYGLNIQGQTSSIASRVQDDSVTASVRGTVAGARVVKIEPKGPDQYETVLQVDPTS